MKKDPIELAVYIATGLFLAYLIYICFIAEPDQFLFGNVFIKTDPIDFGGFGGLLSGIFAPLAFLWLILNFRQQDKNLKIAEEQLKILIQEKTNRRKVTRANFEIKPTKSNSFISPNILFYKIEVISDCDLIDCYTEGFINNTPFSLITSWRDDEICLSNSPKVIKKGKIFYLYIQFYYSPDNENTLTLCRDLEIHYLDSDGFDRIQKFQVTIFIDGENPYTSHNTYYRDLLFIQPQNG